ncbi:hypothetical protein D3C81_1375400 [compost metagenome]
MQLGTATGFTNAQVAALVGEDNPIAVGLFESHIAAVRQEGTGVIFTAHLTADCALLVDAHVAELGRLRIGQLLGNLLVHAFDCIFAAGQSQYCHYHRHFAHASISWIQAADFSICAQGKGYNR